MITRAQNNRNIFLYLLWLGAALVTVKSIFADFGIDNAYAVATSYRHISGDRMFLEMWEPHQTSAFLVDILMLVYRCFVPSFTGVAIFLQTAGALCWIPLTVILHRELSKHIDRNLSHLICAFLFVFRAKQTVFPEFSNMQTGFSILLFVFLVKFICDQTKLRYLITAALFLCLEIISYPTCVIAYLAVTALLILFTERRGRNVLCFSGVCLVSGILYVGYFIGTRGFRGFADALSLLIQADASHTGASMTLWKYLQVFAEGTLYIAGTLAIAGVVRGVMRLCPRKCKSISLLQIWGGVLLFTAGVILLFLMGGKHNGYEWHYCIVLVLLIALGMIGQDRLADREKKIWILGVVISFSSFFAVAALTNCALMSIVAYLSLAAAVSMLPLSKLRGGTFFAGAALLFVLLHRGLIVYGYSELSCNSYVTEVESIIRTGPAAGIVCDETTSCIYRDNVPDFERFIKQEDSVLFIHDYSDSLYYVQAGVGVSASSTISSPTFGSHQIDYWERYGHKTPTVIAIACYNDVFRLEREAYPTIFEWVEANYDWVGDGTWWRFYRTKGGASGGN